MAAIGTALTRPEAGWKRYDDTNPALKYSSSNFTPVADSNAYNSTYHGLTTGNTTDNVTFSFKGTQIRIIGYSHTVTYSNSISITVDGVSENFSQIGSVSGQYKTLNYEKTGLSNQVHTVKIQSNVANTWMIDAIDIDSTGRLLHPQEKTDLKDVTTIGDRIRCHYTASSGVYGVFSGLGQETSDFIPPASSATPNGDFYIIYAKDNHRGAKIYVADRNVQHSISWDSLNSASVSTHRGRQLESFDISFKNLIPKFSNSNTLTTADGKTYTVSASSEYNASYPAYKAVDGKYGAETDYWCAVAPPTLTGLSDWWQIKYPEPKKVASMRIRTSYSVGECVRDFEVVASNDGVNWTSIYTGVVTNTIAIWETHKWTAPTSGYIYWRINIKSLYRGYPSFDEIEMFESNDIPSPSYKFNVRLLTGGTANGDTENEWDKIVVSSTLGGTIIAGDNNVWNWNGVYSSTSTRSPSTSTMQVLRGYSGSASTWAGSGGTTATAVAHWGFRPVFVIESLRTYITKYLLQDGTSLKTIASGSLQTVGEAPVTKALFLQGFNSPSSLTDSILHSLSSNSPQLLEWTDDTTVNPTTLTVTGDVNVSYQYKVDVESPSRILADLSTPTTQKVFDTSKVTADYFFDLTQRTVTVTVQQANDVVITKSGTVSLDDTAPIIDLKLKGIGVTVTINDVEKDRVKYRVLLNGKQIFPPYDGFSNLYTQPVTYERSFLSREVNVNPSDFTTPNNKIEVIVQDEFGKETTASLDFVGIYSGLLFTDLAGMYYTNDLGDILQYLDMDVITAGQTTISYPVRLINKHDFTVTNIVLSKNNGTLPAGAWLEISDSDNPFLPIDELAYDRELAFDEELTFYVRIASRIDSEPGDSMFDIYVKADPLR